jgi:adenosylmethionine-8-amino-7-oxononanoate aminotransferase
MALAATLASEGIFEGFLGDRTEKKTFYHGHTYAGNPLACAAGLASLDVFERDRVIETLTRKVEFLAHELTGLRDVSGVGDVRQAGLMVGVELVSDKVKKAPFPESGRIGSRVVQEMRNRGVFSRPIGDVLLLVLPLVIEEEEIRVAVDAMLASIEEVLGD